MDAFLGSQLSLRPHPTWCLSPSIGPDTGDDHALGRDVHGAAQGADPGLRARRQGAPAAGGALGNRLHARFRVVHKCSPCEVEASMRNHDSIDGGIKHHWSVRKFAPNA